MIVYAIVEGDSEEEFLFKFHHIFLHSFTKYYRDYVTFFEDYTTNPTGDFLFIEYAEGVDKIPHFINTEWHNIHKVPEAQVLVICDTEKGLTEQQRISRIESIFGNHIDKNKISYVVSNPMIEKIFMQNKLIIQKILSEYHFEIFETTKSPKNFDLTNYNGQDKGTIKQIHKDYGFVYKERKFAEKYFGKLQFQNTSDSTIKNLRYFFSV